MFRRGLMLVIGLEGGRYVMSSMIHCPRRLHYFRKFFSALSRAFYMSDRKTRRHPKDRLLTAFLQRLLHRFLQRPLAPLLPSGLERRLAQLLTDSRQGARVKNV